MKVDLSPFGGGPGRGSEGHSSQLESCCAGAPGEGLGGQRSGLPRLFELGPLGNARRERAEAGRLCGSVRASLGSCRRGGLGAAVPTPGVLRRPPPRLPPLLEGNSPQIAGSFSNLFSQRAVSPWLGQVSDPGLSTHRVPVCAPQCTPARPPLPQSREAAPARASSLVRKGGSGPAQPFGKVAGGCWWQVVVAGCGGWMWWQVVVAGGGRWWLPGTEAPVALSMRMVA